MGGNVKRKKNVRYFSRAELKQLFTLYPAGACRVGMYLPPLTSLCFVLKLMLRVMGGMSIVRVNLTMQRYVVLYAEIASTVPNQSQQYELAVVVIPGCFRSSLYVPMASSQRLYTATAAEHTHAVLGQVRETTTSTSTSTTTKQRQFYYVPSHMHRCWTSSTKCTAL